MGCGKTRLTSAPEIDITLEATFIPRFDEIIRTLSSPFDCLISALRVVRNEHHALLKAFSLLETLASPTFSDVLFTAVLTVAADCKGDFAAIGFSLSAKPPCFEFRDKHAVANDTAERLSRLFAYIQHIQEIPASLKAIQGTVLNGLKRAESVSETFGTEVANSNLGALDLGQIRDKFKRNIARIRTSLGLIEETVETAEASLKVLKSSPKLLTTHASIWREVTPADLPTLIRTHFPTSSRLT